MYNTDVSSLYKRVVSLLGDTVWEHLRRSEEGLGQQRFAKTAEGMEGAGSLGAVLQQHDEEAASDCREQVPLNPQPSTLNPQPYNLNLKPKT